MGLEGRYDFREAEPRLQERWARLGFYEFDPHSEKPVFSVDTPPPTVSGQLHIGHAYSYTQADIAVRYHRMRGEEVFYPFGFDDNGLPTERFTERTRGISAKDVGRAAFIQACLELSADTEAQFERFWKRVGLSVDWRLRYSTIDDRSRRISQAGFLDLLEQGHAYRHEAPTLWCPECGTAVAQADVVDKPDLPTQFVTLAFHTVDGRQIPIATTRPELLPSCVAIFVHPEDARYAAFVGTTARVPLFEQEVPILADEAAQPNKGSGAVMCCTFGDVTDVRWWYEHRLPLRVSITRNGRMNELAGPYAGLHIRAARKRIIEDLDAKGLVLDRQSITHTVGVHERCGTDIEYLVASQWFVRLLQAKERFLEAGRQIAWHPPYMHDRFSSWVAGLAWDWNISRQRYYGVPFPIWYCLDCGAVTVAERERLPLDPMVNQPGRPCAACGGGRFQPEADVMDTWATSSLTPQICADLAVAFGANPGALGNGRTAMSLRPNAHDIIRTWNFYTIVRSLYHTSTLPWHSVMVSGHALDESGQKLSKSKLAGAIDPTPVLERYSADAVRYWTAGVRTGSDTMLSEDALRQGARLVTKLWNAARFVLGSSDSGGASTLPAAERAEDGPHRQGAPTPPGNPQPAAADPGTFVAPLLPTDRWLLMRLRHTVEQATAAFEEYEVSTARAVVERFFWSDFCDTYLELVKYRVLQGPRGPDRAAALSTLRAALVTVLKLLAPFLPHVTDEVYLQGFAAADGEPSIHVAGWPELSDLPWGSELETFGRALLAIVDAVRRWKSERSLSVGAPIGALSITAGDDVVEQLRESEQDLRSITRAERVSIVPGQTFAMAVAPSS